MSNEQRNFKPSRVDVDADRMFALQAEGRAELEARKKVATKKQPKPKTCARLTLGRDHSL